MDGLAITTRRTAQLSATSRRAIVDMCALAHQTDFADLFTLLPPDGLHVIARLGADVVGHAVITTRWVQPSGLPFLRTAYVDAVATTPTYQHRGIGRAVMQRLADVAVTEGYEIAGLESDVRGFYEPLGWERWPGPRAGLTDHGVVRTPDEDGVFVLRLPATPPVDPMGSLTIKADGRLW